jgi:DNA polymerase-3 subunit delta
MAAKTLHAFDYLAQPQKHRGAAVCVVFGDEPFLRRQVVLEIRRAVLGGGDGGFSLSTFDGRTAELADVLEELATVAMFGPGQRLVVVDGADEFLSRYREQLEDYVNRPTGGGVLVLDVKSFPANTRLYKAVAAQGLAIDCKCPPAGQVITWLSAWAERVHHVQLPHAAAEMLLEIVGPELGLLDQELAKLALTCQRSGVSGQGSGVRGQGSGAGGQRSGGRGQAHTPTGSCVSTPDRRTAEPFEGRITPEAVARLAGGWRVKTTWEMLDAALAGDLRSGFVQLDRLLLSGESPIGLLGQISASLRRLAAATRLVCQAQAAGRRITLRAALEEAGIRHFVLQKAEQQLRRLGRQRAAQLYRCLLQADLDLKGASALAPRLILERLIIRLAAPLEPAASKR